MENKEERKYTAGTANEDWCHSIYTNTTTRRVPYRIDLLHNQRNCDGKMIVMDTGIGSVLGFNKIETMTDEAIKPLEITQLTVFLPLFYFHWCYSNNQTKQINYSAWIF